MGQCVAQHTRQTPDAPAFITSVTRSTWSDYDEAATRLARVIRGAGIGPGERLAVLLPDGLTVHAAYVAAERAGVTVVGIGHRAGQRELEHLLVKTGAAAIVTDSGHPAQSDPELAARTAVASRIAVPDLAVDPDEPILVDGVVAAEPSDADPATAGPMVGLGPDDLFMCNSTSGTTGLPKCVMHTQNRWFYFHQLAVGAGRLDRGDVFMSVLPAPFGFGLWTAHFTPTILGCPTVLMDRFEVGAALDLMQRQHVTILACVSTQFIMMLNEMDHRPRDLSALRCMFTGGEAVPFQRASEFEDRTGAQVLQFYGSNETGALSCTTWRDDREHRLRTAGRVLPDMAVHLYDPDGNRLTEEIRQGIPACRGPATCIGYYNDEQANASLYARDGWMLMGDVVEIDDDGYLKVVGRVSDFIIRGGKNISAVAVEDEVSSHPGVAMVAAVAMPDEVFGERVCIYVKCRPGWERLSLEDLTDHLRVRGVTREWFPERLVVVDELPRSSGGKVAKGELCEDIRRRLAGSG